MIKAVRKHAEAGQQVQQLDSGCESMAFLDFPIFVGLPTTSSWWVNLSSSPLLSQTSLNGSLFRVLPKAAPDGESEDQGRDIFSIPDPCKIVSSADADFEAVRSHVIAEHSWSTDVIAVSTDAEGSSFQAYNAKGYGDPGASFGPLGWLSRAGDKQYRFTASSSRLLIRCPPEVLIGIVEVGAPSMVLMTAPQQLARTRQIQILLGSVSICLAIVLAMFSCGSKSTGNSKMCHSGAREPLLRSEL